MNIAPIFSFQVRLCLVYLSFIKTEIFIFPPPRNSPLFFSKDFRIGIDLSSFIGGNTQISNLKNYSIAGLPKNFFILFSFSKFNTIFKEFGLKFSGSWNLSERTFCKEKIVCFELIFSLNEETFLWKILRKENKRDENKNFCLKFSRKESRFFQRQEAFHSWNLSESTFCKEKNCLLWVFFWASWENFFGENFYQKKNSIKF